MSLPADSLYCTCNEGQAFKCGANFDIMTCEELDKRNKIQQKKRKQSGKYKNNGIIYLIQRI